MNATCENDTNLEQMRVLVASSVELAGCDYSVTIERICLSSYWIAVKLSDGRGGRAFTFNGAHAVYGQIDEEQQMALASYVDKPVCEALKAIFDMSANETLGHGTFLLGSFLLALANAISYPMHTISRLQEDGYIIEEADNRNFLFPEDHVVLVGAGMLLKEAVAACQEVDVVDMRPSTALQSLTMDASGIHAGAEKPRFHGPIDTEKLFAKADVIGITGCTLANRSIFGLLELPRRAREVILFGPSAQLPFQLLSKMGITRAVTSCVEDIDSLIDSMKQGLFGTPPKGSTREYSVRTIVSQS